MRGEFLAALFVFGVVVLCFLLVLLFRVILYPQYVVTATVITIAVVLLGALFAYNRHEKKKGGKS